MFLLLEMLKNAELFFISQPHTAAFLFSHPHTPVGEGEKVFPANIVYMAAGGR